MLWLIVACAVGAPSKSASTGAGDTGVGGADTANPNEHWRVVVVGGGPAGLAVATQLDDALVLDAGDEPGGRALLAGAEMLFVDTPEQEAAGIDDSVDLALSEWPGFTGAEPTDTTVAYLSDTREVYDRLVELGLSFGEPVNGPLMPTPRLLQVEGAGPALVDALLSDLPATVTVRSDTRVDDLVVQDGRVTGVQVGDETIEADNVVIASGGFASNSEVLAEMGADEEPGAWWAAGDTGATGDAVGWANAHELALACNDCIGWFRWALPWSDANGYPIAAIPPSIPWIWVDHTGARFVDETRTQSITYSAAFLDRLPVWAIAPQQALIDDIPPEDVSLVETAIDTGDGITCTDSTDALASALDIDPSGLESTLADVQRARQTGSADATGRDPTTLPDLSAGPICGYTTGRIAAKIFGGIDVDDRGRVLDTDGEAVEGLYAVGEAAGMADPGFGGIGGFDGSLSAVVWSGWRVGEELKQP